MKKKLSILLVLSMVLSMIPMNVFGYSSVRQYGVAENTHADGNAVVSTADILIDVAQYKAQGGQVYKSTDTATSAQFWNKVNQYSNRSFGTRVINSTTGAIEGNTTASLSSGGSMIVLLMSLEGAYWANPVNADNLTNASGYSAEKLPEDYGWTKSASDNNLADHTQVAHALDYSYAATNGGVSYYASFRPQSKSLAEWVIWSPNPNAFDNVNTASGGLNYIDPWLYYYVTDASAFRLSINNITLTANANVRSSRGLTYSTEGSVDFNTYAYLKPIRITESVRGDITTTARPTAYTINDSAYGNYWRLETNLSSTNPDWTNVYRLRYPSVMTDSITTNDSISAANPYIYSAYVWVENGGGYWLDSFGDPVVAWGPALGIRSGKDIINSSNTTATVINGTSFDPADGVNNITTPTAIPNNGSVVITPGTDEWVPVVNPINSSTSSTIGAYSGQVSGFLHNPLAFKLDAPDMYKWSPNVSGSPAGTNYGTFNKLYGNYYIGFHDDNGGNANTGGGSTRYVIDPDDASILYAIIDVETSNFEGLTSLVESLKLENLLLIADDRAAYGDVNVEISEGTWNAFRAFDSTNQYSQPFVSANWSATLNPGSTWIWSNSPWWQFATYTNKWVDNGNRATATVKVATRTYNEVNYGRVEENANNVTSGKLEQWTSTLFVREIAPNAWSSTMGNELIITVPEGVAIQSAKVDFNDAGVNNGDNVEYQVQKDTSIASSTGVLVKPDYVKIIPPLQSFEDRQSNLRIETSLKVSVEAGYVTKYGTDELAVVLSGNSIANRDSEDSVVLGIVEEPITLESGELSYVSLSNTAYNTNVHEVSDITVTENEHSALEKGDELWVYAIGNRLDDIAFSCDPIATINEGTSLKLSRGIPIRTRWANQELTGMKFTVEDMSRATSIYPDAGVITFTNAQVTGLVYPEVDYRIVVSGNAVAENDYAVYEDLNGYDKAIAIDYALFDAAPYEDSLFEFESEIDHPAPTPDSSLEVADPVVVEPAGPEPWTLTEYSAGQDGGPNPLVWRMIGNNKIGFISLSAFSDYIGATAEWDPATGTATITGTDRYGADLKIVLTTNETTGYINDVAYNIGIDSKSDPTGTLIPLMVNDYIYLPLRFLVDMAYKGSLQMVNGETITIFFR